jgi:hypothetical protein
MYAKVFSQIFESSISEDYKQRHMFMDLLVLADRNGIVDMTREGISRRLNVPLEIVKENITKLEQADPLSRNGEEEGRRIIRLDEHRDWGWQIVNFAFYRELKDSDSLRSAWKEQKRRYRAAKKEAENGPHMSNGVQDSPALSSPHTHTHTHPQKEKKKPPAVPSERQSLEKILSELKEKELYPGIDLEGEKRKMIAWKLIPKNMKRNLNLRFVINWLNKCEPGLNFQEEAKSAGKMGFASEQENWMDHPEIVAKRRENHERNTRTKSGPDQTGEPAQ